jgi:cell division protein ZapA (FtsZ GTPase activity inhibitor)
MNANDREPWPDTDDERPRSRAMAKRTVPVQIFGQEFRIRSEGDAARIRRAAALVDETMLRVRARSGSADTLDVAVLAALNIAHRLLAAGTTAEPAAAPGADVLPELAALCDLVEAALAEEAAAS